MHSEGRAYLQDEEGSSQDIRMEDQINLDDYNHRGVLDQSTTPLLSSITDLDHTKLHEIENSPKKYIQS